jgi:hypothetical protein
MSILFVVQPDAGATQCVLLFLLAAQSPTLIVFSVRTVP